MNNYNEISNYLFMKMVLFNGNIKYAMEKFPFEFKYPIINLFNLDKFVDENELTKEEVLTAGNLLQIILDNSKKDSTLIEYVNSVKIKLNQITKDEIKRMEEELIVHDLLYLSTQSVSEIKLFLKYQFQFDYLIFNLLVKYIYEKNNAIYNFLDLNGMAGTDILINTLGYYNNKFNLSSIDEFRKGILEILIYNKSQIKKSNVSFIDKIKLKKINNKCISEFKN